MNSSLKLVGVFLLSFLVLSNMPPKKGAAKPIKDRDVTKLLKKVSAKYKAYKTLRADFSEITESPEIKTPKKTENGQIWSKGNSFKLVYAGQEIFCNGKFIWTYTKSTKECTKDNYNPNSSAFNPTKIFTIWENGFSYIGDGTYKSNNIEIQKIKLTPSDKTKPYFLMNLEVEKLSAKVLSLQVSMKSGVKKTFKITTQSPNVEMEDSQFEFDIKKYPGTELIDLTK
jgi:outer membrane lipoprotein-sorting protein